MSRQHRHHRGWAAALLLGALPFLGVAGVLAFFGLRVWLAATNATDAAFYWRLCPVPSGGDCVEVEAWHLFVIGIGALCIGMQLILAGLRRLR